MFGIVLGDLALFVLCTQASRMTLSIGRKFPSARKKLVRRYFRSVVVRRLFGANGLFFRMFLMLSLVGMLALANQTVRLTDAETYYGHDTFDSIRHPLSFWVNRVNLATSWCLVGPLFASYLFAHTLAVRHVFRRCDAHRLVRFQTGHPDRGGGFTFFGWLDTIYLGGLVIALVEIALLIVTHRRVTIGNLSGMIAITIGVLIVSLLSIYEISRVVRRQEKVLKSAAFSKRLKRRGRLTVDYVTLIYRTSFTPYSSAALRIAIGLRVLVVIPAALRFFQYLTAKP